MIGENMDKEDEFVADYVQEFSALEFGRYSKDVILRDLKAKMDEFYDKYEDETELAEDFENWLENYEVASLSYKDWEDFVERHKSAIDELLEEDGIKIDLENELEDAETDNERKEVLEEMVHNALFEYAYDYYSGKR